MTARGGRIDAGDLCGLWRLNGRRATLGAVDLDLRGYSLWLLLWRSSVGIDQGAQSSGPCDAGAVL